MAQLVRFGENEWHEPVPVPYNARPFCAKPSQGYCPICHRGYRDNAECREHGTFEDAYQRRRDQAAAMLREYRRELNEAKAKARSYA